MGLGEFADSSRGSATSSKSGGQDEMKGVDEVSEQGVHQQAEEDSNSSRLEEKMEEGESAFPRISSSSSGRPSSFTVGTDKGGGGSGGAAFDDALDGLPSFGPEDDDEDWHFALPMGSLEDVDVGKTNRKTGQSAEEKGGIKGVPFARETREEEEERDQERSSGSANTSHSSQEHTPDNSQGKTAYTRELESGSRDEIPSSVPCCNAVSIYFNVSQYLQKALT